MAKTLTEQAVEQSTYVITVSFTDEDGAAVTPTSATWTLTDEQGVVINNRQGVLIPALAPSVDLLLSGADLALPDGCEAETRLLTMEAKYDSSLGSDLPLKEEIRFGVRGLVVVS